MGSADLKAPTAPPFSVVGSDATLCKALVKTQWETSRAIILRLFIMFSSRKQRLPIEDCVWEKNQEV